VILQTLSRTRRSSACFYLLVVLTVLALPNGPRLSTSPTFSVAMAVLVSLAVLAPYCLLRQVLAPFSEGGSGPTREVDLDDYVSPTRRVVFWIAGLGSLAIPVVFVVLAQSDTYDGSRLYWAGLSALPLSCAAVVIELEVRMGALRDQGADAWTLYLRDALQTRALRRVWTFGAAAAAIAWDMAADALVGVGWNPRRLLTGWWPPAMTPTPSRSCWVPVPATSGWRRRGGSAVACGRSSRLPRRWRGSAEECPRRPDVHRAQTMLTITVLPLRAIVPLEGSVPTTYLTPT
jgi:hypothetical protein